MIIYRVILPAFTSSSQRPSTRYGGSQPVSIDKRLPLSPHTSHAKQREINESGCLSYLVLALEDDISLEL